MGAHSEMGIDDSTANHSYLKCPEVVGTPITNRYRHSIIDMDDIDTKRNHK
jgi:hypothetical protein